MTDIEKAIVDAGADSAPRVTPQDIEAAIKREHYFTAADGVLGAVISDSAPMHEDAQAPHSPLHLLTFCVLELKNGFTVTGESACASPANFNAAIGRQVARANAVAKIWPLLGYELKTKLAFKPEAAAEPDFLAGSKACDLSGDGTCEACQ